MCRGTKESPQFSRQAYIEMIQAKGSFCGHKRRLITGGDEIIKKNEDYQQANETTADE